MYFAAVIMEEDQLYHLTFYKCHKKNIFLLDVGSTDEVGVDYQK